MIAIVGLGTGGFDDLTLGAWDALQKAGQVLLRTAEHPAVPELAARGIRFRGLDDWDSGQRAKLCDELGDVLIQVVLNSQVAAEEGSFTVRDVIANVTEKLIRRHPHVFGEVSVADSAEVLRNWEQIKRQERPERTSVL